MPLYAICFSKRTLHFLGTAFSAILVAMGASLCTPASASSGNGETTPSGPDQYVDRLIDEGNLVPLTASNEKHSNNTTGDIRSIVVELGGSIIAPKSHFSDLNIESLDRVQREAGISVSSRYQTANLGLLGLDAQLHRGLDAETFSVASRDRWNGSLTLTSRDLPLGSGWLVDTTLGTTTTPAIALVRRQTRFYLPSIPILGGSVSFHGYRRNLHGMAAIVPEPVASFNLAIGEPGLLGGLRLSNFTGLSGLAISGGGQINFSKEWSAGVQAIAISDSRNPNAAIFAPTSTEGARSLTSSQGALGTIAYAGDAFRIQANAIMSHRSDAVNATGLVGEVGTSGGGWLDASFRSGRSQHSGGFYFFGPGLAWGTSVLINNAYGGYYRFFAATQRWRWTLNLDAVDSVSGSGSGGVIVNTDVRRKVSFNTSIGLNNTIRLANGQAAKQFLGFVDFSTKLGSTRAEAGWSQDPFTNLYRMSINQNWTLPAWLPSGSRLSTQVSYERRRGTRGSSSLPDGVPFETANSFGASISAGATPFNGLSFDANLAFNSNASSLATKAYGPIDLLGGAQGYFSSETGKAFSASVVTTARVASSWTLSASYTDTTSNLTELYGLAAGKLALLDPTYPDWTDRRRSSYRLRAGYLTLRYSASAGRSKSSLGFRQFPVGGTGNLQGHIFLDANGNGDREPSEAGVAGIFVILDGIQGARTDQAGFYRFEGIADGNHRITLNTDMLPLPWMIEAPEEPGSGKPFSAKVGIEVRSTRTLDIAAIKQ